MTDEQHVEFTPEEIARQRELASKATPRPWNLCACGKCGQIGSVPNDCEVADLTAHIPHCEAEGYPYSPHNLEDAAYIVAAVNTHEAALDTIAQQQAEIGRLREAGKTLLRAAEMRRNWDVLSEDEFNEEYPEEDGWGNGDVDEEFIRGMAVARETFGGAG